MTWDVFATSGYLANPAELYEIRYGNDAADIVRLTSADQDITIGADTYLSMTIERDGYDEDGDPDNGEEISIKLPLDNPFAEIYRTTDFDTAVTFKLRVLDLNDPDQQVTGLYSGRMVGVSWERPHFVIGVERMSTTMRRSAARGRYQRGRCRHAHWRVGCTLNKEDYAVLARVQSVATATEFTIEEAAAQADGHYTGGMLKYGNNFRYIVQHIGSSIIISRPMIGLADNLSALGNVNHLLFTQELDNAAWTKSGVSITSNQVNDADGYPTLDLLTADGVTVSPSIAQTALALSTGELPYTFSALVKESDAPYIVVRLENEISGDVYAVKWLWTAGVLAFDSDVAATSVTDNSYAIVDEGDGLYRISITATFSCTIDDTLSAELLPYHGESGNGAVYAGQLQLEQSAVYSAYQRNYDHLGGLAAITLYPGCDRLAQTCNDKYNNLPSYGGFDFFSAKGPFEGNSLV